MMNKFKKRKVEERSTFEVNVMFEDTYEMMKNVDFPCSTEASMTEYLDKLYSNVSDSDIIRNMALKYVLKGVAVKGIAFDAYLMQNTRLNNLDNMASKNSAAVAGIVDTSVTDESHEYIRVVALRDDQFVLVIDDDVSLSYLMKNVDEKLYRGLSELTHFDKVAAHNPNILSNYLIGKTIQATA